MRWRRHRPSQTTLWKPLATAKRTITSGGNLQSCPLIKTSNFFFDTISPVARPPTGEDHPMATKASRSAARTMMAPAVILLLGWMLVPLIMTLWFSFTKYLPLRGDSIERGLEWVGFANYSRFLSSSAFWPSVQTTLIMVGGVLLITVVLGVLLAMLLDQPMWGQGVVRILIIAPFFVMPTVSALVWKNMMMDPVNGIFAHLWRFFGAEPVAWLQDASLSSIVTIVSWQWLPFATLILLTAIQSLDSEQLEAAEMDGAPVIKRFLVYRATASGACDHHCDPNSNDLSVVDLCRNFCHNRWCVRHPHPDLSDFSKGHRQPEHRAGVCGRGLRHYPCQYRCDLPDAHRWQKP